MSEMKTAKPRIPSPRTGAIFVNFYCLLLLLVIAIKTIDFTDLNVVNQKYFSFNT